MQNKTFYLYDEDAAESADEFQIPIAKGLVSFQAD